MKVKCISSYNDLVLNKLVGREEILEVTESRAKELIAARVAIEIETKEEDKNKNTTKKTSKKSTNNAKR